MLPFVLRRHSRPAHFRPSKLFFSSAESAVPPLKPFSIVEYLVNSWGFSAAEASKASRSLPDLKSTKKPDSVLNFLRSQGFTDSHIKWIVHINPKCVCMKVERNLHQKFRSLLDAGLSESDIVDLITSSPNILQLNIDRCVVPKLEFWDRLFGSRELLLKRLKSKWFFSVSIKKRILPNLKFFMSVCGISEEKASQAIRSRPEFLAQNPDSLQALVRRADELGVPRQSPTFPLFLLVLHSISKETFEAKHKLLSGFGLSESDFFTAIRKKPALLNISQPQMRRKMEFFIKEVGYQPSFVVQQPLLLLFSLEKRVIPRFRVMELLKSKKLWTEQRWCLLSCLCLSDKKFMDRFVLPYKKKLPELLDICDSPSRVPCL